jgi:tight adherence protein B
MIGHLCHAPVWVSLAMLAAGGATPTLIMCSKRRARFLRISGQLPDSIRLMSSAMRAGLGMEAGLNIAAQELPNPIRGEFKKLLNEWRLYGDVNESFLHLAQRVPMPDMRLFVASACLHRDVGGNFVEVLEQLEVTIRNRFQLQRELKMLTAESRMSGLILSGLPIVVAGGLQLLNPNYLQLLLERDIGRIMLWISIILQLAGMAIIRWLTSPKIR